MSISKKCIAKAVEIIDENFTLGCQYVCEDIGKYYNIMDNHGGNHKILKRGTLIQHFEVWEDKF